jgi:hypothetical protein
LTECSPLDSESIEFTAERERGGRDIVDNRTLKYQSVDKQGVKHELIMVGTQEL